MKRHLLAAVALVAVAAVSCNDDSAPVSGPAPVARPSQLSDRDLIRLYVAAGQTPAKRLRRTTNPRRRPGDPTAAELARLRWCESGRDHSAGVKNHERARGFYKFMRGTWRSVGGHGDPAAASYAEQTMRAVLLYRREGWRPWLASSSCTGLR